MKNCVADLTFFINFRRASEERRSEYPVRKDIGPDTCRKWTHYSFASRSSFCLCLRTALIYRRKLLFTPLHSSSSSIPFLKNICEILSFHSRRRTLCSYLLVLIIYDSFNDSRQVERLIETPNMSNLYI